MSTTELLARDANWLAHVDLVLASEEEMLAALKASLRPAIVDVRARNIRAHERYLQAS